MPPRPRTPMTETPCPRCLALAQAGGLRIEAVQRLPQGAHAPLARDGSGKQCLDCAAAELVQRMVLPGMEWPECRIAVANDRQEQYRLPGAPMGLVSAGYMRPSAPGDLEDQHRWLEANNWFDVDEEEHG